MITRGLLRILPITCALLVAVPSHAGTGKYIIGVSPSVTQRTYRSEKSFSLAMSTAMQDALKGIPGKAPKLVIFPEHVGTWLSVADESDDVFKAKTMDEALYEVLQAPANYLAIQDELKTLKAPTPDGLLHKALILHKAPAMLRIYVSTFSKLAVKHNAWVVAGSIAAPDFTVDAAGEVHPSGRRLFNTAVVFDPRGKIAARLKKVYLVPSEQSFLDPGKLEALKPVTTPVGAIGVMTCADGWFPKTYAAYRNASILVQPSMLEGLSKWNEPWKGGTEGADPADKGRITEGQAWAKYSLEGRFASTNAKVGVNVFLCGRLWDMRMGGRSFIISRQRVGGVPAVLEAPDLVHASSLEIEYPPAPAR